MKNELSKGKHWFRLINGILIYGLDAIDLNEVVSIEAGYIKDKEEGQECKIIFYMKSGEGYYILRKYYDKYWQLEITDLYEAYAKTRITK